MAAGTPASVGIETEAETPEELDARTVKAPTESMLVIKVKDDPDTWDDHEVSVYNEDRQYLVNIAIGYCDYPDNHYRQAEYKHLRYAKFALGVESYDLPAWVDHDAVDRPLCKGLDELEELA